MHSFGISTLLGLSLYFMHGTKCTIFSFSQILEKEIKQYLDKGKKIQDKVKNQDTIPDRLKESLSELSSLRGTLPGELKTRESYLTNQKTQRKEYETLVNQFNSWVNEAEKFLADNSAVNIVNITDALDKHNVSPYLLF